MKDELDSLKQNEVWRLEACPKEIKPIKTKWVFRIKEDENGNPVRYKARLVAKGFQQKPGLDYGETYAPVARMATIRTVLAVAVQQKMHIQQLDVKTAFLYGELDETVYLAVPDGVEAASNLVCKLQKSLYGLKQSPRCWNNKLNETLLENGFSRSKHDYCLYIKTNRQGNVYIIIYVDDVLIFGRQMNAILEAKTILSRKFQMTDCGDVSCFLGMKIQYDRAQGRLCLSHEAGINRILTKFGLQDCNYVKTPMEKGCQLPIEDRDSTNQPYRELLGSIMYTMLCVRPDISYSVGYLGRYQQNPGNSHWQALKRTARYLKGTKDLKLEYTC